MDYSSPTCSFFQFILVGINDNPSALSVFETAVITYENLLLISSSTMHCFKRHRHHKCANKVISLLTA